MSMNIKYLSYYQILGCDNFFNLNSDYIFPSSVTKTQFILVWMHNVYFKSLDKQVVVLQIGLLQYSLL